MKLPPFDKYDFYIRSVQSPEGDVDFLLQCYKEIRNSVPKTMREDFCGTHAICCDWVKRNPKFLAYGLDLDSEPLDYGIQHYQSQLTPDQRKRLKVLNKNVLSRKAPHADVICALNFSYFIFKTRLELRKYFLNAFKTLNRNGLFVVDCFGGPHCEEPNEEETVHKDFSYFWDQDSFDPVTLNAQFYIHFKRKGEAKRLRVFSYDWRMWSIPELCDLMKEVGFKQTHVYWEGTTAKGEGDGEFRAVTQAEPCDAWVAYVVGEK